MRVCLYLCFCLSRCLSASLSVSVYHPRYVILLLFAPGKKGNKEIMSLSLNSLVPADLMKVLCCPVFVSSYLMFVIAFHAFVPVFDFVFLSVFAVAVAVAFAFAFAFLFVFAFLYVFVCVYIYAYVLVFVLSLS
jgi:hypothetical protein